MIDYEKVAEWSQVAASVLFVAAMAWIWVKFIMPAVLKAQQNQNAQLAEAEHRRDEAKAALDALQGEMESAKRDAQAMNDRVAGLAAAERESALRESREAGERAVRNAQGELERCRASARDQLRDELLNKALDAARVKAAEHVDSSVNARLVSSFVSSLEHGGRN